MSESIKQTEQLRQALRGCLDLLLNSHVAYTICNGEGENLGEHSLYHRTIDAARNALRVAGKYNPVPDPPSDVAEEVTKEQVQQAITTHRKTLSSQIDKL